jgi:hypothetical protein
LMTVLKPAAKSRFSVCCVLAQPTAKGYKREQALVGLGEIVN